MPKRSGYDISVLWAVVCLLLGCIVLMGMELAKQAKDIRHLNRIVQPGFAPQNEGAP